MGILIRPADQFGLMDFLREVYVPSRIEITADSVRQVEISIRLFERWVGRKLTIAELTEDLIRQFLAWYRALPRSANTVNSKRCQLLALWQCAWDEEYLQSPPRSRKVRKLKTMPLCPEAWTAAEVARILKIVAAAKGAICGIPADAWWKSLLLVYYDTGGRKSEALKAAPADLCLTGKWIVLESRKNGRRICPLHAETISAVSEIWSPDRDRIWPWPFSREALDKRFRKILSSAGVPYGRKRGGLFHKLRRTSGTLVESNGGDGARQIGDTRAVFEKHYWDRRFEPKPQLDHLPRPN